jgi:hypothetical protein
MTVRPWNDPAGGAANAAPVVLILKKSQGSVWSEAGRTPLCPTVGWLRDNYGAGQYELRLKLGNRIVCMANAECVAQIAAVGNGVAVLPRSDAAGMAQRGGVTPIGAQVLERGSAARVIGGAW